MYWVFIWRLFTVYRQSAYSYPRKCILIFAAVFLIWCTFVTVLIWAVVGAKVFTYGGASYPNWCAPGENVILTVGSLVFLSDILVAIGFLFAFLRPLRKTIKAVKASDDGSRSNVTRRIIYAGTKTTIITAVGTISTVIFTIMAIITGIGLFGATDPLVNSVCVVLMASYYPDKKYYEKICCCFIRCCRNTDKEQDLEKEDNKDGPANNLEPSTTTKAVDSNAELTATTIVTTTNTKSVDTASQLRVAAENYAPEMNNDNYVAVESPKSVNANGEEIP